MADIWGLVGKTLGNYEIVGYLSSGGMSSIYEGHQQAFKRNVAIKVTTIADAELRRDERIFLEFSQRFNREAKIISQLNHPHILKVFDYGEDHGFLYLVMDLYKGGTLSGLLQQGRVPLAQTAKIVQDLAEALDYAHQHGVIHRDIKPQNVLMDEQGNAILTDFGIAKVIDETSLTNHGAAVGTPAYMSPEQWQGGSLDGRCDQYSLAVMAYEMLSGMTPFPSDTPYSLMTNHLNSAPPPLCLRWGDIPRPVEYVINKALSKDREARYASVKQFAAAFAIATRGQMPADDPLDTPPLRRKDLVTHRVVTPPIGIPLSYAIGHDATVHLSSRETQPKRIVVPPRRTTWLTIGAAGILVLGAVLVLLVGSHKLPLVAQSPSDTPTITQTPLPPTATNTSTPVPPTATFTPVPPPTFLTTLLANDFEHGDLDNFLMNGGWNVQADKANKNNHIFCIITGEREWNHFNLAGSSLWSDYSVEFRVQILDFDNKDGNAGNLQIALRVQDRAADGSDPSSYYAGLDATSQDTFLQKWTQESGGIQLGNGTAPITIKQWYNVRVEIQGVVMRLFVDDALSQTATDTSLTEGSVGIQAAPNTAVCVDDLVVRSLIRTTATMMDSKRVKLTSDQPLSRENGKVIADLKQGTELFVLAESSDMKKVYVRDDDTARQGWLSSSVIVPR